MSKIVFGMRPDVRIVGLPAGCVGAVVRMANAAGAVIRLEFADRWEDYHLADHGDGTASPLLDRPVFTARRVAGDGPVLPHQAPFPGL